MMNFCQESPLNLLEFFREENNKQTSDCHLSYFLQMIALIGRSTIPIDERTAIQVIHVPWN